MAQANQNTQTLQQQLTKHDLDSHIIQINVKCNNLSHHQTQESTLITQDWEKIQIFLTTPLTEENSEQQNKYFSSLNFPRYNQLKTQPGTAARRSHWQEESPTGRARARRTRGSTQPASPYPRMRPPTRTRKQRYPRWACEPLPHHSCPAPRWAPA